MMTRLRVKMVVNCKVPWEKAAVVDVSGMPSTDFQSDLSDDTGPVHDDDQDVDKSACSQLRPKVFMVRVTVDFWGEHQTTVDC